MSQPLPVKECKWVSPDEIDILNVRKDSKRGYIIEVDLKYPKELHDKHNLYPLAPEHVQVTFSAETLPIETRSKPSQ